MTDNKLYFAVSDVHSYYSHLMQALANKKFDINNKNHILIICGDLFDRGYESEDCLAFVKDLAQQNRLVYVRGNHEDLLEDLVPNIEKGFSFGRHHISNGTVNTLADLIGCSVYDILCNSYDKDKFNIIISELMTFIKKHSVNYFELGHTVFVHGWIPTTCDEDRTMIVPENWRDEDWDSARWKNGMEMFHLKIVPSDVTTIVCGHWHTSFAWSRYEDVCPEWGELAKFDAYIKDDETTNSRIVALDACTVYSNKVNCVVFDEEGNIID